jgi:large subunit ribosomal protein L18
MKNSKQLKFVRRKNRTRSRVSGSDLKPRLSIFRSNKHIQAQLIDDINHNTILTVTDINNKEITNSDKTTKTEISKNIGLLIAKYAKDKKITSVTFDRGGYRYHGRVKAVADGAREGGLIF